MERVPCNPLVKGTWQCLNKQREGLCREDIHHEFYPRRDYTDSLSRAYRELDDNKVLICRDQHNDRHAEELPPIKPTRAEMAQAVLESDEHLTAKVRRLATRAIEYTPIEEAS